MKKVSLILSAVVMTAMIQSSCGNSANEVTIGNQVWMAKNLNVDKFRNGDPIPEAKSNEEWRTAGEEGLPAWCYYDNNTANGAEYGKLYNWYAVNDPRGLAPKGWHIPSDAEWRQLTEFLGGADVAAGKMKSAGSFDAGTGLWQGLNEEATNESGFSGLPGGGRFHDGRFKLIGEAGCWWSSTESDRKGARGYFLSGDLNRGNNYKWDGLSVRCRRD